MSISKTIEGPAAPLPAQLRRLREAQAGNRSAFDELIGPMIGDLQNFVSTKVDSKEVDDVVQEVLLAAWRAIPNFDGRSRLRTWLFGICIHKVKDHYRNKMRRIQEVPMEVSVNEPVTEGTSNQTDLAHAVKGYLSVLSASQSEVIELYYHQNLTLAEVASVLDRNLNTVKYQFCQAHFRLAKSMKDGGFI